MTRPSADDQGRSRKANRADQWLRPGRAFGRPFWASTEPLSVAKRVPTILEWIRDCKENHPQCVAPASSTLSAHPARFVDIRGLRIRGAVKLIRFADIPPRNGFSYVTLSHCWGGVVPLRTLKANLRDHLRKIPMSSIPRTFSNAIILAQALGIGFLWIDSLCIIQDDPKDWQTEAAKMHTIYRGAVLAISATSSKSPNDGPDLSVAIPPAHHIYTGDGSPKRIISTRYPGLSNPMQTYQSLPILTRGWTFQEQLLSPRILHVMDDEFIWQCHALLDTESGRCLRERGTNRNDEYQWVPLTAVYTVPRPLPRGGSTPGFATDRLWWTWIQSYIDRRLTYPSDIFPAFGGMVKQFVELSGDEPVLGLWRRELPLHLSWSTHTLGGAPSADTMASIPDELRALTEALPSWTWMSMPIPHIRPWTQNVEWSRHAPESILRRVEVLDIDIAWAGEPWTSLPSKGILTLRGRMMSMAETHTKPDSMISEPMGYLTDNPNLRGNIVMDRRPFNFVHSRETFAAMALWSASDSWYYLVLEPTRRREGEYRRVGRALIYYRRRSGGLSFDEIGSIETVTVV